MTTDSNTWIENNKKYRLCRGNWRLESFRMTPVGLGIKVGYSACNLDSGAMWSLLDLLHLIREIALQANCLMPIIVRLPMSDTEGLRRRQDMHRGQYLLLCSSGRDKTDLLLQPQPVDIRLAPEKYCTLGDIRDKAQQELNPALYERLFKSLPVIPKKEDAQKMLQAWKEQWEVRLDSKRVEKDIAGEPETPQEKQEFLAGLGRIRECSIIGFKGINQLKEIDLNADIILVTGANGNGKSSFVEALSLTLTGYHPAIKSTQTQQNKASKEQTAELPDHFFHYGVEKFSIELAMEAGEGEEAKKINVVGKKGEILLPSPLRILRYPHGERSEPVLEELNFRLTSYLPDHVNLLFDENVTKESQVTDGPSDEEESSDEESPCRQGVGEVVTVRDLFPSLPLEAEALCHAVQGELGKIRELKNSLNTQEKNLGEQTEEWLKKARDFFTALNEKLNILLEQMNREKIVPVEEWQQPEPTPREFADALKKQGEALRPALGIIDKWSLDSLEIGLESLWERYSQGVISSDIAKIASRLEEKEQDLKRIEVPLEGMEGLSAELEQLRAIFSRLGEESFCRQSSKLLRDMGMNRVADEVDWVDPVLARSCGEELAALSGKQKKQLQEYRDQLTQEIEKLDSQYQTLEKELPAWNSREKMKKLIQDYSDLLFSLDTFTRDMKKWKDTGEQLKASEQQVGDLQLLADFLENQRANLDEFRKATQKSLNSVLRRFVMAGGLEADEVEVEEDFRLRADKKKEGDKNTKDEEVWQRTINCLSSGQKAQLAMAWMVACRELMHNPDNKKVVSFPHRVMIMDDPSTTFDLNNLHSQAILWRQLAYNENPSQRYQIFIVSHHEEFSSRLLDLLCPPGLEEKKKCRMKLLRFTDWTVKDGAKMKTYEVEQAPQDIKQGYKLFRTGLKYLVEGQA